MNPVGNWEPDAGLQTMVGDGTILSVADGVFHETTSIPSNLSASQIIFGGVVSGIKIFENKISHELTYRSITMKIEGLYQVLIIYENMTQQITLKIQPH